MSAKPVGIVAEDLECIVFCLRRLRDVAIHKGQGTVANVSGKGGTRLRTRSFEGVLSTDCGSCSEQVVAHGDGADRDDDEGDKEEHQKESAPNSWLPHGTAGTGSAAGP